MARIEQATMSLTRSEKSPKTNTIWYFPQYCHRLSYIPVLIWSVWFGSLFSWLWLFHTLPRDTEHHHCQTAVLSSTKLCLWCSLLALNQVLAQSNAQLQHSPWTLLLPGQLPGKLSSGNSLHCFSESWLWLQRFKMLSHQYADVLHWFCLDIF